MFIIKICDPSEIQTRDDNDLEPSALRLKLWDHAKSGKLNDGIFS